VPRTRKPVPQQFSELAQNSAPFAQAILGPIFAIDYIELNFANPLFYEIFCRFFQFVDVEMCETRFFLRSVCVEEATNLKCFLKISGEYFYFIFLLIGQSVSST